MLRNYFQWQIVNLLHKDKEHLALRNNSRVTKKFLITKLDCSSNLTIVSHFDLLKKFTTFNSKKFDCKKKYKVDLKFQLILYISNIQPWCWWLHVLFNDSNISSQGHVYGIWNADRNSDLNSSSSSLLALHFRAQACSYDRNFDLQD